MAEKKAELSSIDLDNLNAAIGSVAGGSEYFGLRLRRACMTRPETFHGRTVEQNKTLLEMFIARVNEGSKMKE